MSHFSNLLKLGIILYFMLQGDAESDSSMAVSPTHPSNASTQLTTENRMILGIVLGSMLVITVLCAVAFIICCCLYTRVDDYLYSKEHEKTCKDNDIELGEIKKDKGFMQKIGDYLLGEDSTASMMTLTLPNTSSEEAVEEIASPPNSPSSPNKPAIGFFDLKYKQELFGLTDKPTEKRKKDHRRTATI